MQSNKDLRSNLKKKPASFQDVAIRRPKIANTKVTPTRTVRKWRPRLKPSLTVAGLVVFFVVALVGSIQLSQHLEAKRYAISPEVKQLIGASSKALSEQIKFDTESKAFQYNQDAARGVVNGQSGDMLKIGGSEYYGVSLGQKAAQGQTVYDAPNKLAFSMKPQFEQLNGKQIDGAIVYPFDKGQVIYTLKDDGIKEDIVIPKKVSGVSFAYKLELPDSLMAQLNKDGSVGVYSVNKEYQAASIAAKIGKDGGLKKPEKKAEELRFTIPRPVVIDSSNKATKAEVWFELKNDKLTINAKNLQDLSYPISIDPSVTVNSSTGFNNGYDESNTLDVIAGSIARKPISAGTVGSWNSTTSGLSSNRGQYASAISGNLIFIIGGNTVAGYTNAVEWAEMNSNGTLTNWTATNSISGTPIVVGHKAVAYNGYIYVIGGTQGGGTAYDRVQYAAVCTGSNETIGFQAGTNCTVGGSKGVTSWCPDTGGAGCGSRTAPVKLATILYQMGFTAYNGYLYITGGCTNISAGWCHNGLGVNRVTNIVRYMPLNLDGSMAAATWNTTTAMNTTRMSHGTFAYNGYIYALAGCSTNNASLCNNYTTSVEYAAIGKDGTIGKWTTSATTLSFSGAGNDPEFVNAIATRGYVYAVGGDAVNGDVKYASIYASGDIGSFGATTAFTTNRFQSTLFTNKDNLQIVAGCTTSSSGACSVATNDSQYAPIDSISSFGGGNTNAAWASTGQTISRYMAGSATYDGFIYNVGGCTATTGGTCTVVTPASSAVSYVESCAGETSLNTQFTTDCTTSNTPGQTSTWKNPSNAIGTAGYGQAVTAYNGYLYVAGGCTSGTVSSCSGTYGADMQYARICTGFNTDGGCSGLSRGELGTWSTSQFNGGTGRWGAGLAVWDNRLYVIGGTQSGGVTNNVRFALLGSNGAPGSWSTVTTAGTNFTAQTSISAVAYNGYIYFFGGVTSANSYTGMSNAGMYAKIGSNGDLDGNTCGTSNTWCATTNYTGISATGMGLAASDGVLYLVGGSTGTSGYITTSNVRYAYIASDGTLSWQSAASNNSGAHKHGATVIANGYLYAISGASSETASVPAITSTTEFTAIRLPSRVANYSRVLDTASTTTSGTGDMPLITRYSLNSSSVSNGAACYSFPGSSLSMAGVSSNCGSPASLSTRSTLPNTKSRYIFMFMTLDDSLTATALDDNPTTITGISTLLHAGNDRRLRGGKTFTDMNAGSTNQNQLDTE